MKRLVISVSALLVSVATVNGASDPIEVRTALMQANAAAAATAGGMMRGTLEYNPAVAKAAIMTFYATSNAIGAFYPENSNNGDTEAAPAIWEDPEGFQRAIEAFKTDAAAAVEAAGENGPPDLATFQQAVAPVMSNCRDCHEPFRLQKN